MKYWMMRRLEHSGSDKKDDKHTNHGLIIAEKPSSDCKGAQETAMNGKKRFCLKNMNCNMFLEVILIIVVE